MVYNNDKISGTNLLVSAFGFFKWNVEGSKNADIKLLL